MTMTFPRAFALGGALLASALPLAAQELRFADSLPATHQFTKLVAEPWMQAVTEGSGGAVTFQHYPAQQLGKAKDMLSLVNSGVTDISFVVPIYISDKLPLSGVYDLPGGPFTSCQGVAALLDLATGDGILAKNEFGPNGVRVLMAVVQPPFQVFTASKPIASVKDLSGLKLRTAGGAQAITAGELGIVPINITAPETSEAMSRGTIDGAILAPVSVGAYGLTDLIKYATVDANFGSAALTWAISESKFQSLPKETQDLMIAQGRDVSMSACGKIQKSVEEAEANWKANGVTLVDFPAPERAALAEMFNRVGDNWAKNLDGRGLPGSEVLTAFKAAVEANQ